METLVFLLCSVRLFGGVLIWHNVGCLFAIHSLYYVEVCSFISQFLQDRIVKRMLGFGQNIGSQENCPQSELKSSLWGPFAHPVS